LRNTYLDDRTARDIDQKVDRVHRDLNYSEGKIELAEVRDLLRLDLKYYRLDDPNLLDEVVHKVKVGAKQIIERPTLLIDAARKFDLSALFIPDRKRIFIDAKVPDLKKRWYESHEVAHSLIPWHSDYMLGDDRTTLSQGCHQAIEAEANYGAGRLLFPPATFTEARLASHLSIVKVREIAKVFGNTITSTLWRCIEHSEEVAFAAVGEHPRRPREGKAQIEYFIRSKLFELRYPKVTEHEAWAWMKTYCGYGKAGPLGTSEVVIEDANGIPHRFAIESFSIGYSVLTLARLLGPANAHVSVPCTYSIAPV
jgi:Zn-dependent peptidase ImmA (M78 family)